MITLKTVGKENSKDLNKEEPNDTFNVQSVKKDGSPVRLRVASCKAAYNIYEAQKQAQGETFLTNARLAGMYNGNPPHNQAKRESQGFGWMPNVNTLETQAIIDLAVASKWDMLTSVPNLFQLTCDEDVEGIDAIGRIVSEEATKIIKGWVDFDYNVMLRCAEMDKFGCGPAFWSDEYDWRSQAIKNGNLILPKKTRSSIGKVPMCFIMDELDPIKLIEYIESGSKVPKVNTGWNKKICKDVLVKNYLGGSAKTGYQTNDFEKITQQIRNRDYSDDSNMDDLKIVHMLIEEMDGTVTHAILSEDQQTKDYMYFKRGRFESISSQLHLLLFNIGDGFYYSVRGLLARLYHTGDLSNRMFNDLVMGAMMASGIIIQLPQGFDYSKLGMAHIGAITVFNSDVQFVENKLHPNLQATSQVKNMIQALQSNNTGVYRPLQESGSVERTKAEVEQQSANEARFETSQAAWYYVQWEAWLYETLKRLMNKSYPASAGGYKEHKKFIDNCRRRGVSDEWLSIDKWNVKAWRSIGLGSPTMRIQIMDKALRNIGLLDEKGRNELLREWYAAHVQWANVKRFISEESRDKIKTITHSMAESENVDMSQGFERSVAANDEHKIHLDIHLPEMGKIAAQFAENISTAQNFPTMKNMIVHCVAHLKNMSIDPSRKLQVKNYGKIIAQFSKILNKMISVSEKIKSTQADQQRATQQKMEQMAAELDQRKWDIEKYKIDKQFELDKYEADLLNKAREQKTETSTQTLITKSSRDIARKDALAQADIKRKDRDTTKNNKE